MSLVRAAEPETAPSNVATLKALLADTLDLLSQLANSDGDLPANSMARLKQIRADARIQHESICEIFPEYAT